MGPMMFNWQNECTGWPGKKIKQKNARGAKRNSGKCRGYDETQGHTAPAYITPNLLYLSCPGLSRTNPGNRGEIMKTAAGFRGDIR